MNQTGMSSTTLFVSKQSVAASIITDAEYNAIMTELKASLPADMVDPAASGAFATAPSYQSQQQPPLFAPLGVLVLPSPGCVPSTN
eukprot:4334572-Prymnesium_polylepis.1